MKIVAEKTSFHRFALYYDYTQARVDFCKSLKESFGWQRFSYDSHGDAKRWVFSDSILVPVIQERFPEIEIDPVVKGIVDKEQQWNRATKVRNEIIDVVKTKIDTNFEIKGLKKHLYPYQKVGVEFLDASGGRAIIADAPGLGKTAQALAYIKYMGFKRALVISPASVKFSWKLEVSKWTSLKSVVIDSNTDIASIDPDVQVWICNYDILKKHYNQLVKTRFDCIVGDEAQMIKSTTALRTKAFRGIARTIDHVVLLSGTPLLSRPSELFSLLNIVDEKTWPNWYDYARKYCDGHQGRFGFDASGVSNAQELHARIKRYFIRRDKTEVLKELPPKNFIDVPVELDKMHAKQYKEAASDLAKYLRAYSGKQPAEIAKTMQAEKLARLNVLRMLCAMGKIDTAIELIESVIDAGEKVLVFSSFVAPLEDLKAHFKDQAVMITGKTDVEDRQSIVESFQEDKKIQVFLGGIKSAGVGITLTAAANVIFLDFSWNPADHQQAQDRVHRPGQTAKNVNIYQLLAMHTIDDDLKEMLETKQDIFDEVIEGKVKSKQAPGQTAIDFATKRILKDY